MHISAPGRELESTYEIFGVIPVSHYSSSQRAEWLRSREC
jgi:hypothetical protein